MKKRIVVDWSLRLAVFIAAVGLWELFVSTSQNFLLPRFTDVARGFFHLLFSEARFWEALYISNQALILGFAISVVIGIPLGLGIAARVFIVVLFAFVFITVNTRAGVRGVEASLIEMAKSFGASEGQIWRRIVIPGAMPAIFAGMRIGLGRAITGMVMVELILVASGLGRLLLEFSGRMQSDLVFATVLAVIIEALALLAGMQALEKRITRWAPDISIG